MNLLFVEVSQILLPPLPILHNFHPFLGYLSLNFFIFFTQFALLLVDLTLNPLFPLFPHAKVVLGGLFEHHIEFLLGGVDGLVTALDKE